MPIEKAIPQLPSLNLAESREFYLNKLGFSELYSDQQILVLKKDDIELHLLKCDNKLLPQNSSCYFHVSGIDSWYAECEKNKTAHPDVPLADKHYGMREFIVKDCHGNLLKFGEALYGK